MFWIYLWVERAFVFKYKGKHSEPLSFEHKEVN